MICRVLALTHLWASRTDGTQTISEPDCCAASHSYLQSLIDPEAGAMENQVTPFHENGIGWKNVQ